MEHKYTVDEFLEKIGTLVNVTVESDDVLTKNFTGWIVGVSFFGKSGDRIKVNAGDDTENIRDFLVQVEPEDSDGEDDVWEFWPHQISPCTDAIMHGDS